MGLFPTPLLRSEAIYLQWLVTVTKASVEMGWVKSSHEVELEDPALETTLSKQIR